MILPVLVLMLGLQDNSGEIAAQRAEISRLQQDVQRVTAELQKTQALVQNELRPSCSAQSRLDASNLKITDVITPVRVSLFAMVSNPGEACLPAEIGIIATYQDSAGVFVCSGNVGFSQSSQIQNTLAEFLPYEPEVFLKWWEGPTLRQKALRCLDFKGDEVRSPTDQATTVRIYVTVFPKRGGLSTSEIQLSLPRVVRP